MASEKHSYRFYRVTATNENVLTAVINVNMVARKLNRRASKHTAQAEVTRVYACVVVLGLRKISRIHVD